MFKRLRRLWELWKKSLFDSYEPKPTVYKIGNKRYVKVKRFRTKSQNKGPYLK
jgi:hypothetical protein